MTKSATGVARSQQRHAESRRLCLRRTGHAGAAARVAGNLLAAAADPAAAQAGALSRDPAADRTGTHRADADEDAMVAAAAAHAAGRGPDPGRGAAAAQSAGRPARPRPAPAGDRRRLGVGAGLDDAHRPRRTPDPACRTRQPPRGAGRHRTAAARRAADAPRRAASRGSPHHPARLPAQAVADRSRRRCCRHRPGPARPGRLCRVARRRAAGRGHRQAHRTAAPLQRPRSRPARPSDHAAAAVAAGRRRPRSESARAAPDSRRPAQDGGAGLRRPGPHRGPHRSRIPGQRAQGRRRAAELHRSCATA